ncbi:MAG: glucose 1-dehydrogenase [Kiloniellales bacterium]
MMKGLAGKNVLVTGAASGIGQAVAVRFAEERANVTINFRRAGTEVETAELVMKAGARCVLAQADVTKEDEVVRSFEVVRRELGELDVLVNNAGIQIPGPAHETNLGDFDKVISVNVRGPYLCAREAIKHFLAKGGGVIVNISSVHEIIPKPKYLSYSMSKGGLGNLTQTLALEYADRGIRVNSVGPGATVTPINRAWIDDPKARAEVESHIPMGRAGTSEEVAAVVAFLASDEAAYITGQTLYVDGGLTLYPEFRIPWSSGD